MPTNNITNVDQESATNTPSARPAPKIPTLFTRTSHTLYVNPNCDFHNLEVAYSKQSKLISLPELRFSGLISKKTSTPLRILHHQVITQENKPCYIFITFRPAEAELTTFRILPSVNRAVFTMTDSSVPSALNELTANKKMNGTVNELNELFAEVSIKQSRILSTHVSVKPPALRGARKDGSFCKAEVLSEENKVEKREPCLSLVTNIILRLQGNEINKQCYEGQETK
ncbi:hypothetical protein AVEN_4845-1 [Araneus ventricosus]|uniref:Uncharacterized protein n=1 Tax=Araneus ventricosus TaxID=182803 RepID=A0A4Y2L962_ARAVE|nr:hypothetical protein AVEN_4845-1 [Araneus ventricosus]